MLIFFCILFAAFGFNYEIKLVKPSFNQISITERLWNLQTDQNKNYYKQEDFNWDSVNENEWEEWEEEERLLVTETAQPVLRQLRSIEVLNHHLNAPEHISSYLKERLNWL